MYPNRVGFAVFGDLEIECLEIFNDQGLFDSYEFRTGGFYYSFPDLCESLEKGYLTIAKLLSVLGREKFINAVLEWNPADQATKDSFYDYLAKVANQQGDWGDHPW